MSEFTPGKWYIAPPIFDGDAIFAPPQHEGRRNEVIATQITNHADAQLIAKAPLMYELLRVFVEINDMKADARSQDNQPLYMRALVMQDSAIKATRELLARIDSQDEPASD